MSPAAGPLPLRVRGPLLALFALAATALPAACAGASGAPPSARPRPQEAATGPEDAAIGDAGTDARTDGATDGGIADGGAIAEEPRACPKEMAFVDRAGVAVCIDRWEGALVDGEGQRLPHFAIVERANVRAESAPDRFPAGYVSRDTAAAACSAAGKRLCTLREWRTACLAAGGPYPYGARREESACNDAGRSPLGVVFPKEWAALQASIASTKKLGAGHGRPAARASSKGAKPAKGRAKGKAKGAAKGGAKAVTKGVSQAARKGLVLDTPAKRASWQIMNDPRLLQIEGTVTKSGERSACRTPDGVYDLVGNLHEWVSDDHGEAGIFAGGYFLDTKINGEGCMYSTRAHAPSYHDYSIGFRCCQDAAPGFARPTPPPPEDRGARDGEGSEEESD